VNFDKPDYTEWQRHIQQMFREAPLTWVPALLIEAMKGAKEREAFIADGMSRIAARIEVVK